MEPVNTLYATLPLPSFVSNNAKYPSLPISLSLSHFFRSSGGSLPPSSMAADGLLRPVYEACIAGCDSEIHRRPYHRNCGCALHKSRRQQTPHCSKSVSYPINRSWSEGCLTLVLASSASSSPSSSPVVGKSSHPAAIFSDDDHDDAPIQFSTN